ncbi:MAG: hypothetical protein NTW87_06120 [Planctomycetota bacterium]|nr:hypothetical protein [Planctomycetota bacterium]
MLNETASKRVPGLSVLWESQPDGSRFVRIVRAPSAPDEPVAQRVLTGVSRQTVSAAINAAERLPDPEFANAFFAMHLFAFPLADNPSRAGEDPLWRRRTQSVSKLRKLAFRVRDDPVFASPETANLEKNLKPTDVSPEEMERCAWGHLFPDLRYHGNVDIGQMQIFRDAVVKYWRKRCEEAKNEIDFNESLRTHVSSGFADIEVGAGSAAGKDGEGGKPDTRTPDDLFRDWVSYSIHAVAEMAGKEAIDICEAAIGNLSVNERQQIGLFYGCCPYVGGTSIAFAQHMLRANPDMRADLLSLCDVPIGSLNGAEAQNLESKLRVTITRLCMLGLNQMEADKARKRSPVPSIDVEDDSGPIAASAATQADAADSEGEQTLAKALESLSDRDRIICHEYVDEERKPSEIAESHCDWGLTPKQISDRWREIREHLAREVRKYLARGVRRPGGKEP